MPAAKIAPEEDQVPKKDDLEMGDVEKQQITVNLKEFAQLVRLTNGTPSKPPEFGNPGPLGLGGFALTTFMLSVFNAGVFIDSSYIGIVLPLALFYGGLAQFIAGFFEYRLANTFGATAFCSYGAFWMSFAAYIQFIAPTLDPTASYQPLGLFLLAWTIFTLYMLVASLRVNVAVTTVFVLLELAFICLTVGTLAQSPNTAKAGGWFGIFCAFSAWYCSAAVVINSTWGRTVLPIGVYPKDKSYPQMVKDILETRKERE